MRAISRWFMEDRSVKRTTKFAEARQQQDASETDLVAQLETIQLKDKQLQRFVDDAKEYLAKKDKELVARILRKVDPLLEKIAKKRDYTIIIKDPNALAYLCDVSPYGTT